MSCVVCDKPAKKKYCSKKCQYIYEQGKVPVNCKECGTPFLVCRGNATKACFKGVCRKCVSQKTPPPSPSGPDSPTWKGGYRYWSPGRFGKDKDGLSWKTQRKLAWERDEYTCQHCHEKKNRNPDVHHISPFRVSQSHAIDNLLCLCQSCHLKIEATVQDEWGENPQIEKKLKIKCAMCGNSRRKLDPNELCRSCFLLTAVRQARVLLSSGMSHSQVATKVGVNRTALYKYLKSI